MFAPPVGGLVSDPQVRQGLYYNPYFPGGAIAMPRMLADGGVEYDDGTPSNSSQQAKVGMLTGLGSGFKGPCCPSVGALSDVKLCAADATTRLVVHTVVTLCLF